MSNSSGVIPASGAVGDGGTPAFAGAGSGGTHDYMSGALRRYVLRWIPAFAGMTSWMEGVLAAQKENLILWVPVIFACGIGAYFGLSLEPPAALTAGIGALAALLWFLAWPLKGKIFPLWVGATAAFLFVEGFALAQARTIHVAAPMREKEIKITRVTGTVETIEDMEEGAGQRYILSHLSIEKLPPEKTPEKVRLRVRTGENVKMRPGDRVEVLAGLNPPSAPAAPGAFDFQRFAFFRRIGAFGYTYETPRILENRPPQAFGQRLELFRENMIARVNAALPDPSQSSIAGAMMTGERAGIPQADNDAMQAAGLAHMLSISGMHIGMIATTVFFSFRFLLALFPAAALRFPIKKIAAGAALATAAGYVLVIGFDNVPAVRSLLMTGFVLVAVMLDRVPFSLRTVGLAAFVVLAIWPDALWTASFQMSFSAVAALIWFYEATRNVWLRLYHDAGVVRKIALYLLGLAVTSLVASAATAPFVLYHFQRASLYGVLANLLGVPVLGAAVMPAVVLAYILMPFGWEYPALWAMGKGIQIIMAIARDVAAIPGANLYFPALPLPVFIWLTASALVAMIWRGRGKWFALLPLAFCLLAVANASQPDILVSADGKLISYYSKENGMSVSSRVNGHFTAGIWAERYGFPPGYKPDAWPKEGTGAGGVTCGEGGCRLERDGRKVAFSFEPFAQAEDCAWADILIARYPVAACRTPVVIDIYDLRRDGAYALWLSGARENVGSLRGMRPWSGPM